MDNCLGKNLKKLRKARGNTQEELARYLGISVQSVSKWECYDGMPDITLLPKIAIFYGVTVDRLLGIDEVVRAERIRQITEEYGKIRERPTPDGLPDADFHLAEGIEVLRAAVRELPDCWFFCQLLASDLWQYTAELEGDEKTAVLSEAETLCRLIRQNCKEDRYRHCANEIFCLVLHAQGRQEESLALARSLPDATGTKDFMLTFLLDGEELQRQLCVSIEIYLRTLYRCVKKYEEQNYDLAPLQNDIIRVWLEEIQRICVKESNKA